MVPIWLGLVCFVFVFFLLYYLIWVSRYGFVFPLAIDGCGGGGFQVGVMASVIEHFYFLLWGLILRWVLIVVEVASLNCG